MPGRGWRRTLKGFHAGRLNACGALDTVNTTVKGSYGAVLGPTTVIEIPPIMPRASGLFLWWEVDACVFRGLLRSCCLGWAKASAKRY